MYVLPPVRGSSGQTNLCLILQHGQICMGTEKIIAHESIFEDLSKRLALEASQYHMTSAVSQAGAAKTEALVREALEQGAKRATPAEPATNGIKSGQEVTLFKHSAQLYPTVLTNVTPSMRLYGEESFGPTVYVLPFKTEDEAVKLANESEYGLSASVFTQDIGRAIRVAKRIDSGAVHVNSMTIHDEPQLPHGGMKNSGWGRFNIPWGTYISHFPIVPGHTC